LSVTDLGAPASIMLQ